MLAPQAVMDSKGKPWDACQVIHPSCEITAKTEPPKLHVVRVRLLSAVQQKHQRAIVRGFNDVDGSPRIAWANTFFLPPADGVSVPMFSDFRQVARVDRSELMADRRIAALTHDARVFFIRRKLYWEQRWMLSLADVYCLERSRIGNDDAFIGTKPPWAAGD